MNGKIELNFPIFSYTVEFSGDIYSVWWVVEIKLTAIFPRKISF